MNTPALAIFAYRRPQALQSCLASLASCAGADALDATVFVDGPADATEQALVAETARIAEAFKGFRTFEVRRADTHLGLGESVIRGISHVLETHPSVIVLEDDLTVQPGFLRFILDGLDRYSEDRRVFSVCGYTNRIRIPEGYPADAYFCPRSSSWGWGTWKDRWDSVDWEPTPADWAKYRRAFAAWGGSDCPSLLRDWMEGKNASWAIRFCFSQFRQGKLSLFPVKSLVDASAEFDGSGTSRPRSADRRFATIPYPSAPGPGCATCSPEMDKPRILFLMHMPPPVHGAAVMGGIVRDSEVIRERFESRYVNYSISRSMDEIDRFSWKKIPVVARLLGRVFREVVRFRPDVVYVTPSFRPLGFRKDRLVVRFLKRRGCQVVLHLHNKGVAALAEKPGYDQLLRSFFEGTKVILLSERLFQCDRRQRGRRPAGCVPSAGGSRRGFPMPVRRVHFSPFPHRVAGDDGPGTRAGGKGPFLRRFVRGREERSLPAGGRFRASDPGRLLPAGDPRSHVGRASGRG